MKLVYYPDPVLRQPAQPVRLVDGPLRRLVAQMFDILDEAKGLGLAAQQVGSTHSVLVMSLTGQADGRRVYLNPRLVRQKGFVEAEEGCLSFPGLYARVRRAREVTVEAYDLDGQVLTIEADDLQARCWQHEIDHLNGILFIDRMSEVVRLAVEPKLKELEEAYARQARRRVAAPG